MALRAQLCVLRGNDWQRATAIMQRITALLGKRGPSHGMVQPRQCTHCKYFGHTRQWCKRRKQVEEERIAAEINRDREWLVSLRNGWHQSDPEWDDFIRWTDRRWEAAKEAGLADHTRCTPEKWDAFLKQWEESNPEPYCESLRRSEKRFPPPSRKEVLELTSNSLLI